MLWFICIVFVLINGLKTSHSANLLSKFGILDVYNCFPNPRIIICKSYGTETFRISPNRRINVELHLIEVKLFGDLKKTKTEY